MSEIAKLLAVQTLDIRIRDTERELKDIPARKAQEESRLREHKEALDAAHKALKARQADLKQLELESESRTEKIQKLRQQQMTLKSNKEFKLMEDEIAAIRAQIGAFEDKELVIMETIDAARSDVAERERALKQEEAAVREDTAVLDARLAALQAELAAARAQRGAAAALVEREWLDAYAAVIARKDRALVPVENGVCGGCHMQMPPYIVHATMKPDARVTCGFCGRLLYGPSV